MLFKKTDGGLEVLGPPQRLTIDANRATFSREISDTVCHMEDDYHSIMGRVSRLVDGKSAWSEDPPSRVRRFITNVAVGETETADEFEVVNYLLVARNRFDQETYQLLCAGSATASSWCAAKCCWIRPCWVCRTWGFSCRKLFPAQFWR